METPVQLYRLDTKINVNILSEQPTAAYLFIHGKRRLMFPSKTH